MSAGPAGFAVESQQTHQNSHSHKDSAAAVAVAVASRLQIVVVEVGCIGSILTRMEYVEGFGVGSLLNQGHFETTFEIAAAAAEKAVAFVGNLNQQLVVVAAAAVVEGFVEEMRCDQGKESEKEEKEKEWKVGFAWNLMGLPYL